MENCFQLLFKSKPAIYTVPILKMSLSLGALMFRYNGDLENNVILFM